METVNYTVQRGDTLYQLAKRYGTTVGMIARYNGIADPDRIREGQTLCIPVSEIRGIQEKKRRESARGTLDYVVRAGDTLLSLAKKYGLTPERLAGFNGRDMGDELTAGLVLRIPLYAVPVRRPEAVTVRPGDSLWMIAQAFGTDADTLATLNHIDDPDRLSPGQVLRLPAAGDRPVPEPEGRLEYTVRPGDSLWMIARKYGVSVAYLINMNRLTQPDRLVPGQVLLIRP